jgi:signal transduction histidine kinase
LRDATRPFLRRVVALVAVLLGLGAILMLVLSVLHARHAERTTRAVAVGVVPSQRALQEVNRGVADLAVAGALRGGSEAQRAQLAKAREHLDWAIALYHPPEDVEVVRQWQETRRQLLAFEQGILQERPVDPEVLPLETDAAFAALHTHASMVGERTLARIGELSQLERRAAVIGVTLTLLIGAVCVALLLRAMRREQRAWSREQALLAQLERTNADLEAFAGRIAHDLRGPLSPILAGSQLIESAPVSSDVKRVAERIERGARRLFSMIDALLTFTRLSGTQPTQARAEVGPVIEDVLSIFSDAAAQIGATFDVRLGNVGAVQCEPEILSATLQNLLENALKYGIEGSPDRIIEVRAGAEDDTVILEVEDHGKGVPPHLVTRIFEPFFQAGPAGKGGIGLGLATVRRLVDARHGTVELVPGRRGGALFRVRLPRARDVVQQPARP